MTIRDLIEQGICLQGWIKVIRWDCEMEKSEEMQCRQNTNGEHIPKDALDLEIRYMYADDNTLVIEVIEAEK